MYRLILAICLLIGWGNVATAVTTRYEAENVSTTSTDLPTETSWPGYSGTSYLCCWGDVGRFVTFSVNAPAAGTYTLAFGYSAGNGVATRRFTVNGTVITANQAFAATANWSTWAKLTKTVALKAGTNTIEFDFTSSSSQFINIDYLDVTPPVLPSSISLTPSSASIPNNSASGLVLSQTAVTMNNGSAFSGTLTISGASFVGLSNGKLVLTRKLTSSDNGLKNLTVTATQNGGTVSATFGLTVGAVALPTSVSLTPSSVSIPDNSASGLVLSNIAVTMNNGSTFSGTLTISSNPFATISSGKAVLSRKLTVADDGVKSLVVTATQNGGSASATLALTVTSTISLDGTVSTPPSGPSLTTAAGIWTWGSSAGRDPGEYNINLTGVSSVGIGTLMEVDNGGKLYVNTVSYGWFLWENGGWVNSGSPTIGLASEWLLTSASVSGTTVADASGNNNIGTILNGPLTFGTMGANFNGLQYINSALAVTSPALTVSVWFNAASLNPNSANPRLVANSHTDVDDIGFQLQFNAGGATGFFDVGTGTAEGRALWSKQLVTGTWYHYVGVYDGSTVKAYINGVQLVSTPFSGGAIAAASNISVGRNPAYDADYFNGAIYDVRIYQRALSASEITTLYQATTPPPPTGPTPTSITLSPASVPSLPEQAVVGTVLSTATVTMSDGSQFGGTLTTSNTDLFAISGMNIVTKRAYVPADDGMHTTMISIQ